MSDYYHHFLSSMTGVGEHQNPNTQDASPTQSHGLPLGGQQASNLYQNLGYFTGFPEPIMFNSPKAQRSRRKSAPGLDHIKHRRTRSGCYTCRSRRVKCDEGHPICERCRKGKRDCLYPDPPTTKGASSLSSKDGSGPSQQTSPSSSRGDEDDDEMDQDLKLEPIIDEDEGKVGERANRRSIPGIPPRRASTTSSFSRHLITSDPRQGSETPSQDGTKSSSPSVSAGATSSLAPVTALQSSDFLFHAGSARPDWSFLPQELQFYLGYFYKNVTHHHYCMVSDSGDFFRSILPSIAVRDEALLYAIVGFSAYHHTLKNPTGQIREFLQYYNRSVTLLLGFLKRKEKHHIGTLLTILQLATIEEYLGDWVSLMGHQRAAFEVFTQLFTPESAMQSPTGRVILAWYARFDIFVGIMGRFETALPRVWLDTFVEYCDSQVAAEPEKPAWKIEACSARLRLISMEMSILFSKGARSELTGDTYFAEHQRLSKELQDWKDGWDSALTDPAFLVTEFSNERALYPNDDIVNPFAPGVLFKQPLFASTLLTCEWHSIVIMHESQAGMLAEEDQPPNLGERAYAICQIFEAIELWTSAPNGSLFVTQACLAIAALFVPRDTRHHMWIRRKFALLEAMGYIFPLTMRTRMAELFGDQACIRWWLPDDEGFTPILKSLRMFADERNATAVTAQTENLREVGHIFETMRLAGSIDSPATTTTDDGPEQPIGKGKGAANWAP